MSADPSLHERAPAVAQTRHPLSAGAAARTVRQLEAIDRWNAVRRMRVTRLEQACRSREDQESASRSTDALRRTQEAIEARAAADLAGRPGPVPTGPTAVIAHRHSWFLDRLAQALADQGVGVLASTGNGPDALGAIVAEQPDIVLAGDRLEMMTGPTLLSEAYRFAPAALRGLQLFEPRRAAPSPDTADVVFLRHQRPAEVAVALATLHTARA